MLPLGFRWLRLSISTRIFIFSPNALLPCICSSVANWYIKSSHSLSFNVLEVGYSCLVMSLSRVAGAPKTGARLVAIIPVRSASHSGNLKFVAHSSQCMFQRLLPSPMMILLDSSKRSPCDSREFHWRVKLILQSQCSTTLANSSFRRNPCRKSPRITRSIQNVIW